MAKILGLDLGTNSIGWAVVEKDYNEFSLLDKGVRIFSEGVKSEKGIESSRAAERTGYRSARKIKYRRKLRKYETLKILSLNAMCPLSIDEVNDWKKSGFKNYPLNPEFLKWLRTDEEENVNPYAFRDRASKGKVSLLDFGRALYHISQRRGFLSNRLDQSAEGILEEHCPKIESLIEDLSSNEEMLLELKDYFIEAGIVDENIKGGFAKDLDEGEKKLVSLYKAMFAIIKKNENDFAKAKEEVVARLNRKEDLGAVKREIGEISQAMKEGNFATLGQYFYSLYNKDRIRNKYTAREEHYLKEFEILCKMQGIEGIYEEEQLPEKRYFGLAKDLYKAIFFQRPLKSQKGLIGKCSFEKSKSRCSVSHPDFEEYRMWTYLNTIKYGNQTDKILRFLTQEEKLSLIPKFFRKKDSFNFEDLAKELIPKGATFCFYKSSKKNECHFWFNYKPNDTVSGCPVSASLKNIFGEDWKTKTITYKTKNAKGIEVNRTVDYNDLWHLLSVSTSDIYLFEYAKEKLGLDDKSAKAFSKIRLKKDFASLSLSAITKILFYVKQGLLYSHAVFMANIEKIVDEKIWNDANQRKEIQDNIAKIIENHIYENGLLEVINSLIKNCKTPDQNGNQQYYSLEAESSYRKDLKKQLSQFFKYNKIENDEDKEEIVNELFPIFIEQLKAYQFIKIKRLDEKVIEFLKGNNADGEQYCSDEKRIEKLYHPSDIDVFKKIIITDENGNETLVLGSPLTSSIKNPMAMRALHQLRKVLNALILEGQIDENTIIHIEMARELNDANKRKGIQDYQNELKKNREESIVEIKKLYLEECGKEVNPTEDDLLRYQLWLEQNRAEIYEEGKNISICDIIGSNPKYDIEHTVPRSRSQDNSQMNKTLCSQKFNRDIKGNKMPIELNKTIYLEILPRIAHWKNEAEKLEDEIKSLSRSIKATSTKEQKDRKIRKRHYLKLKKDYLQGKYDRFVWEEPKVGFKNSQIPDTGIITKYSQAFLKSYFKRVESVKGGMVAEFRKQWGIQESYIDENGFKQYRIKDRSQHTHHTIDAITIACMTKDKYDVLAKAWTLEDEQNKTKAKAIIEAAKPWETFTEDLKKLEDEILVSHFTPDNVKKQSKKIVRIRGKKQFRDENLLDKTGSPIPIFGKRLNSNEIATKVEGKDYFKIHKHNKVFYYEYLFDKTGNKIYKKIPIFQQGDTARGSLHKLNYIGVIAQPEMEEGKPKRENGAYILKKDSNENVIKFFVKRNPITKDFSNSDVNKIVDEGIKERIEKHGLKNVTTSEGYILLPMEKKGINGSKKDLKEMLIKRIRLFEKDKPFQVKRQSYLNLQSEKAVRKKHKHNLYAQNDVNYCMAIYEGEDKKGKIKRSNLLINMFETGKYFKLSNTDKKLYPIAPEKDENNFPLKYILTKGKMVLIYDKSKEELFEISHKMLLERLFEITQLDGEKSAEIKLLFHQEAREKKVITEFMGLKTGMKGGKNIGEQKKYPWIKIGVNSFDCLVEGYDFKISASGKIDFL